jgi:hypothetical protein
VKALVERLRTTGEGQARDGFPVSAAMLAEAADEIERARAIIAAVRELSRKHREFEPGADMIAMYGARGTSAYIDGARGTAKALDAILDGGKP